VSAARGEPMSHAAMVADVTAVVGADHVVIDPAGLARLSGDYSLEPATAAAVAVAPAGLDELVEVVAVAERHGSRLAARGAAMSYTRAHTPVGAGTVLVDTRRMNRVLRIDERDLTATVEAGCTWEELYLALRPRGVRTPFWGPLSGHSSTVGGAMSQNAAFLGSARYGSAVDAVLGLTVVLADGRVLRTGAHARRAPGLVDRHFGPDLTGIFLADAGAMGLKAEITMGLVPAPTHAAATVFAAHDIHEAIDMITALARPGLATDIYAFDGFYHRLLASQGLEAALPWPWTVNVVVEGLGRGIVDAQLELLRAQLRPGTTELDASAPLAMRADPFGATRTMFAAEARAVHLPVHGIVSPSASHAAASELEEFAAERGELLAGHGIRTWTMLVAVGQRLIIEPTLFFEGEYGEGGEPEARRLALELRRELARRLARQGATHNQVGKYYPLAELIDPASWECLSAVKHLLDPGHRVNPGALGLAGAADAQPTEPAGQGIRVAPA
jgi:FAD/FMN-containing dehydrogenase